MVQNLEGEEWRDVGIVKGVNFTGYYQVSNKERVKRLKRTVIRSNGCCQNLQERLMNPKEDKYGYMRVYLTKDGIEKPMFLHRLVALAFVPNPDPKHKTQVNHIDENKKNNTPENLEWCDCQYNVTYGTAKQRAAQKMSVPLVQIAENGVFVFRWSSGAEANRHGYEISSVCACARGEQRSYRGCFWIKEDDYNAMGREQINEYMESHENEMKPKRIVQLSQDGEVIKVWESINSAEKEKFYRWGVKECLRKERETYKGYIWKYI